MSLDSMRSELMGAIPKLPREFTKTLVNRAWRTIRERNLWSFLLFDGQWISPPIFTTGLCAAVIGSNQIILDATATAALNAALTLQPYSLITARQFRIGLSGIYNIWSYDDGSAGGLNTPFATLTLDRLFGESSATTTAFQIFQCYYVPQDIAGPLLDFKTWISVRNIINFLDLFTDKTREMLDALDPQRTAYFTPTDVVYYQQDQNPASSTRGAPLFELWGVPQSQIAYQLYGVRRGLDLAAPSDTLPPAVGEDCVLALARAMAYEWAEANKDMTPRSSGPDFRFLIGAARKEYEDLLRLYRREDRETYNAWFSIRRNRLYPRFAPYYNSISGTANPGGSFG